MILCTNIIFTEVIIDKLFVTKRKRAVPKQVSCPDIKNRPEYLVDVLTRQSTFFFSSHAMGLECMNVTRHETAEDVLTAGDVQICRMMYGYRVSLLLSCFGTVCD